MNQDPFFQATIEGLQLVGHRYVVLTLKSPASFHFYAGQYTQLEFSDLDGRFKKYYSIASAPRSDHTFELCLLVDDTRVWQWIRSQSLGQTVRVAPAAGNFHRPHPERRVIMIGGGSGITPLKALFEARAQDLQSASTILLYGCQNDGEIPFYHELLAQTARHPKMAVHFFAEDLITQRAQQGRPLDQLHKFIDSEADYLLCGPKGMMESAHDLLIAQGIPPSHIHRDRP